MELDELRKEINEIDEQLLKLLAARIDVLKRVGEYKARVGKPIKDPEREEALLKMLTLKAKDYNISEEIVKRFWTLIFNVAYELEEKEGAK